MAQRPVADAIGETVNDGKISKESVNYRPGDQVQNCGKCMHFDAKAEWCRAIVQPVLETDVCDLFADMDETGGAAPEEDLMAQLFGGQNG